MPQYMPPNVSVNVLDNPRIINSGDTDRIPAIIALGPTTRTVVDEVIQRGSGSSDALGAFPGANVSVSQIANTPGIGGGPAAALISVNGALYNQASASIATSGRIFWPIGGTLPNDVPATGSVYYVNYSYSVPSTQFNVGIFSDKNVIRAMYRAQDNAAGILTVGGLIALENGSPSVILVQASGSAYVEGNYKAAIDKLRTKRNIEQLICLFPSASVTRAQQESLLTYAYVFMLTMNNQQRELGLMAGSPALNFTTDGLDTIGDPSTSGTYLYRAAALKNRNVVYVVPSRVHRPDDSGNLMELDANFGAVAVAGVQAAQPLRSTPIHGFVVTGITIQDEKWNETEMNQLGGGNCLVLQSRGGVVTIRDAITTDPTSANTQEVSVVSTERLVKRTLRTSLANIYTNKGKVITQTTTLDVEASTRAILQGLVNEGELFAFGERDNPTTGELKIQAQQNPVEPRQIDVTCSIKYLYPLKFVAVTVSTFV